MLRARACQVQASGKRSHRRVVNLRRHVKGRTGVSAGDEHRAESSQDGRGMRLPCCREAASRREAAERHVVQLTGGSRAAGSQSAGNKYLSVRQQRRSVQIARGAQCSRIRECSAFRIVELRCGNVARCIPADDKDLSVRQHRGCVTGARG